MLVGLTHIVSPRLPECELTFIDREPVNYQAAVEQHENYCAVLTKCGAAVKKLSVNLAYPDACFVEDTAVVVDELAVITSMGAASRRGEIPAIKAELARYREVASISLPATLEGGDILRMGKKLFVGLTSRTNAQGVEALTSILGPLGYDIRPVAVRGSLHLKTACTALDNETLLVNPRWVDVEQFKGYKIFHTPAEELWAANTLRVGDRLILREGSPQTIELVRRHHELIEVVDISELAKAEAGLSCLSLIFEAASH